jgi:signal transduction histidine kinase
MRLLDAFPMVSADIVAAVEHVFAGGEPVVGLESSGVDGRAYLLTMFPVRNALDEVEQVGCMFLDVSDRVSAERALADSEQRRREILATLLQAEEVERSRIATELHDDTVQVMAASLMALDRAALVATKAGNDRLAEALANVRKHARASRITVRMAEHDGVLVGEVADDGRGFDVDDVRSRPDAALHMGLDSMVERVRAAGGEVTIDSEPGAGTRVRFAVPTVLESPRA